MLSSTNYKYINKSGVETEVYSPDNPQGYDLVIKTQADFEILIASSTWFDATSVAFVGQFTLSTANNSGVKRPANVTRIDGYNNATITVMNFKFNSTTAQGGLWDDGNANNQRCYINDLTINCISTDGIGKGFNGNNNTYSNCTGTGIGPSYNNGFGFYGDNNTYSNCTGTGNSNSYSGNGFNGNNNTYSNCTGTGTSTGYNGYGFRGNYSVYTNCTGTGNSNGIGFGFNGDNNTYTNCTGIGTGKGNSNGFNGSRNRIISCTALAYLPTDRTPNNTNCVPICNSSTSANLFMIIRDCKFPEIEKSGYQQGTIWCNIDNNTTMVGSIKDNLYHSRFTVAPIKGANVVADNNSAVNITAI